MNRLKAIARGEENLLKEMKELLNSGQNLPTATRGNIDSKLVRAVIQDFDKADHLPQVEAVVVPYMRPVLFVKNGKIELPESNELKDRMIKYRPIVERPLKSVGRIELKNHQFKNIGTGWLVSDEVVVTNRHVAEVFAVKSKPTALGASFKPNFIGDPIQAVIDFKEEYALNTPAKNQFEIRIEKVLFLADSIKGAPDIALLKIKKSNRLPDPIPFISNKLRVNQFIGVVGYPFQDPRGVTDPEMERRIFGNVFGVKRYAPGQIIGNPRSKWYFLHDASTLGGNSGSLVQDMETGGAIGLHFGGLLLEANYAVKGAEILETLAKLNIKNFHAFSDQGSKVLVEHGFVQEKAFPVKEYSDRKGYELNFLDGNRVSLPTVKTRSDILKFGKNKKESVIKYTHFSVLMSKSRRLCFYSAVNIDGKQYVRLKRPGWRYDSRIPKGAQIMNECYGDAPRFSRGHMTRREDPNWGPLASAGNEDSMHVTNVVPQMQPFNGGVWLTLENYALENSKQDKQKISVFTGPFFHDNDPVRDGVRIPVAFWKVIAFIHDDTGKLCATGYTISQEDYLNMEEFIFGEFQTYQVPIRWIEKKAGISFGKLRTIDPLAADVFESIPSPLQSLRQIRFY
ncbi:MAG TPA: DNA/RNA non-specific endonuclease [Saprospiraceae bacterium]|nr:DNA/RNA non-specific endonuclease [Saprospiraceae bacterium]HNT19023.1 DNA/RNA non-specific endonuclease [Saprospiraceae bacterium]